MKPRRSYSSDLSDEEWQILQPLVPEAKPGGRPRIHQTRELLDAIFYVVRGGCAWRLFPTTSHPGKPPITTSGCGVSTVLGRGSIRRCGSEPAGRLLEKPPRVRPSYTASRLGPPKKGDPRLRRRKEGKRPQTAPFGGHGRVGVKG